MIKLKKTNGKAWAQTSICILRCVLNDDSSVRKIANDSSKTAGTEETPFLDNATQRYCLMAVTNISCVQNTGPAFWRQDSNSSKERILDRSSWDLQQQQFHTTHYNKSNITTGYNIIFLTLRTKERMFVVSGSSVQNWRISFSPMAHPQISDKGIAWRYWDWFK